jgi:hypothetical protein
VLAPGTLLPHMEGAWFERVVFRPGNRAECSDKSRFFTGVCFPRLGGHRT